MKRRGSALLESALSIWLLLPFSVALMDVGQVFFVHHFLSWRVRTAARWAVLHPYDAAAVANIVVYNTATPGAGARSFLALRPEMVAVSRLDPGLASERVQVRLEDFRGATFSPFLGGRLLPRTFTAVAQAESYGQNN